MNTAKICNPRRIDVHDKDNSKDGKDDFFYKMLYTTNIKDFQFIPDLLLV